MQTFEVIASGLTCSVQPSGGGVTPVASQRNSNITARIFFVQDIGAVVNDMVETQDASGVLRIFQVKAFERGPYNRRLSPYFLDCEELK